MARLLTHASTFLLVNYLVLKLLAGYSIAAQAHPMQVLWSDRYLCERIGLRASVPCRHPLVDSSIPPDRWNVLGGPSMFPHVPANGEPPEQMVKVTDRKHRFPVLATVCSLAFLATFIAIIIVCVQ